MRKLLAAVVALTALVVGGSTALAHTEGIDITNGGFNDHAVSIETGDAVSWKNTDSVARTVFLEDGDTLLPPDPTPPGGTSEVRFSLVGEYVFLDPEHPERSRAIVYLPPRDERTD